jgi:hypothetical protein
MGIRCLGVVAIEPATWNDILMIMDETADREEQIKRAAAIEYLKLEKKRYIPITEKGEVDQSENRCKILLGHSKKEPQLVGEISEFKTASTDLSINFDMMNRLWVYDGKLYQSARNDYNQKQIHLLILDFLDKEKRKFQNLKKKFKNKEA